MNAGTYAWFAGPGYAIPANQVDSVIGHYAKLAVTMTRISLQNARSAHIKEVVMDNLYIYNSVRVVPEEAKKAISGGRLNGKTDINPMWRIKKLTEEFGVCGIGWKYEIVKLWLEPGGGDEVAAFAEIKLYIRYDGEWSEGIPGIGGSAFVAKEKSGLYTSDECYKMALTDAISVSCKALGFGADVYWGKDSTKYSSTKQDKELTIKCEECKVTVDTAYGRTPKQLVEITKKKFGKELCSTCAERMGKQLPKEVDNG